MPDFDPKMSAPREREKRMIELVDRMLDLVPKGHTAASQTEKTDLQRVIEETDRQIDTLVYEFYGLSDAEIAIVERQTLR